MRKRIIAFLLTTVLAQSYFASWYWPFGGSKIDVKKVPEVNPSGKYRIQDPVEKANRIYKKKDPADGVSVKKLKKLANAGNANAQLSLGKIYFEGLAGEKQNYDKAFDYFYKAARNGNPEAMYNVAICYDGGFGVFHRSLDKAMEWYIKSAEEGVPEAQLKAAVFSDARGDSKTAFRFYKALADSGNTACMNQTAQCLFDGYGTEADPRKATEYWTKAAERGDTHAQVRLADCYQRGVGVPLNLESMFKWLELAALDGDPEAQAKLGKCFEDGLGIARNPESAFRWYRISAEAKYPQGQYLYAKCLQDGIGTAKDPQLAFENFLAAAENGEILAEYSLYECYRDGIGTVISPENARESLVKAAENGSSLAQAQLAIDITADARANNPTLKEIPKDARLWLTKAETSKDPIAMLRLAIWYLTTPLPIGNPEHGRQILLEQMEKGQPGAQEIYQLYFGKTQQP